MPARAKKKRIRKRRIDDGDDDDATHVAADDGPGKKPMQQQHHAQAHAHAHAIPLRLAVRSGYLASPDVGRMLLLVRKDMMESIFEDMAEHVHVGLGGVGNEDYDDEEGRVLARAVADLVVANAGWRYLCQNRLECALRSISAEQYDEGWRTGSGALYRWSVDRFVSTLPAWRDDDGVPRMPSLSDLVGSLLEELHGGGEEHAVAPIHWESVFRCWYLGGNYAFIISLYDVESGASIRTRVVVGEEAQQKLLTTGRSPWLKLDQPHKLGEFGSEQDMFAGNNDVHEIRPRNAPSDDDDDDYLSNRVRLRKIRSRMIVVRMKDLKSTEVISDVGDGFMPDSPIYQVEDGSIDYVHVICNTFDVTSKEMSIFEVDEGGDDDDGADDDGNNGRRLLSFSHRLRTTISESAGGRIKYDLSHIRIETDLVVKDGVFDFFCRDFDYRFRYPQHIVKEGVTLVDVLEKLKIDDWK